MTDTAPLPAFLEEQISAAYPGEVADRILAGLDAARERPVTLRANALKTDAGTVAGELERAGIGFARAPWYPDAFALADVLDMCAAPGGKTSQIAALTGGAAHLTACEMSVPRAERLEHNLAKLGCRNVQVMRTDARRLDEFFSFDQILLDAPCTGSGTVRAGDPRAAERITPKLLDRITRSQRALLDRALSALKPGGSLVYSTCSVLPAENEDQVERALRRHRDCEVKPIALAGADEGELGLPLLPGRVAGALTVCPTRAFEGFFMVRIEKGAAARRRS